MLSAVEADAHGSLDAVGESVHPLPHSMIIGKRDTRPSGTMKKIFRDAALVGVFLLLTGYAVTGEVTDKRALGQPGRKVFQLHVDGTLPAYWVTVSEREWDKCGLYTRYPVCVG